MLGQWHKSKMFMKYITLLSGRRNITCTSYKYTEKKGENKKVKEKTGSDFCYI